MNTNDLDTKTLLLPCPFCGAQPVTDVFEDEECHFHFVNCVNEECPAASVFVSGASPEEATALWNTRK